MTGNASSPKQTTVLKFVYYNLYIKEVIFSTFKSRCFHLVQEIVSGKMFRQLWKQCHSKLPSFSMQKINYRQHEQRRSWKCIDVAWIITIHEEMVKFFSLNSVCCHNLFGNYISGPSSCRNLLLRALHSYRHYNTGIYFF